MERHSNNHDLDNRIVDQICFMVRSSGVQGTYKAGANDGHISYPATTSVMMCCCCCYSIRTNQSIDGTRWADDHGIS
jgi:hypothetical protein